MTTEPISVLLRKCNENDRMAQHELFNLYKRKVFDLAYKSLGRAFDIDDVVQQIFIALFNSLKVFKGNSSFDTWVYRISIKICTTQLRKKYRKRQPHLSYDPSGIEVEDPSGWCNPLEVMRQKELEREVYGALDKLSVDKRMIVVLYEMEGRSLEEIALIMKKPVGTIKSRLFHGRKALEKHLRGHITP